MLPNIILIAYQVVIIAVIIGLIMDNRPPVSTMAWALVIWFVPVVGIVLFLLFGLNTRKEKMVSRRQIDQLTKRSIALSVQQEGLVLPETYRPLIDLFKGQSMAMPFKDNTAEPFLSGYDFFASLLKDIAKAQSHIHIDVYIFLDDALGMLVSDALIAKARQGVEVRVIYDDVGCWKAKHSFFERMREEGIEVMPFLPVRFPPFASKVNYRNHRKLFVIDGKVAYVGGMNIALRYVKGIEGKRKKADTPWRDTMLRLTGSAVHGVQQAFLVDWYFVDGTLLSNKAYYPQPDSTPTNNVLMQMVTDGPASTYPVVMHAYVRIILGARRYVYIQSPYFMPPEPVLFALKTAAASGVDVRLMVPKHSDGRMVEWAQRSYLREAEESGVRVVLYEAGFLHSKLIVSDDTIAACGSTNVDFRSFENNFEDSLFIYDSGVATALKHVFEDDEQHTMMLARMASRMDPRPLPRLVESVARLFAPLL